jgi:hypothetical protein
MSTRTRFIPGALTALCGLALALPALAEDSVVREYTFPLTDINEVEFQASVGSMRIVPIEANEIRLVLEIESRDRGWFNRARDVSRIELESRVRGDRLVLEQDEDDTETHWTVQMPAVARTTIHMGVGEIKGEFGATELDIDLGVGEVDITAPEASTGDIALSVGVGDASLRGASEVRRDQAFVSQDVDGRGEGTFDMRIDLGVGSIDVDLE